MKVFVTLKSFTVNGRGVGDLRLLLEEPAEEYCGHYPDVVEYIEQDEKTQ